MSKRAADHHKEAQEFYTKAAEHHGKAADAYEDSDHEKAAHHAEVAAGNAMKASDAASEAAQEHAEEHGDK